MHDLIAPRPFTLLLWLAVAGLVLGACGGGDETAEPGRSEQASSEAPVPLAEPTTEPTLEPSADDAAVSEAVSEAPSESVPGLDLPPVAAPVGEEPVVMAAEGEKWTNPGWTVAHDGALWMFRNSFSAFPGDSRTDLLRSDDAGRTWTEVGPVITDDDIAATDGTAFVMSGWIDEAGWHGVVATYEGPGSASVFVRIDAPGPEGPWTVAPEPLLRPGASGGFDDLRIREPSVALAEDGTLHLYYTGWERLSGAGQIGLATSSDGGQTWEGRGAVLAASQAWDGGGVGGPQVLRTDDGWVMLYDSGQNQVVGEGVATSADGLAWEAWQGNPVLARAGSPGRQSFFQSEVLTVGEEDLWLLEVGGNSQTSVHLLTLDLDVVRTHADLPQLAVEVDVTGTSVQMTVALDGQPLAEGGPQPVVFVDRDPLPPGVDLPDSPNIVRGAGAEVEVEGLRAGAHVLWVGMDDGGGRTLVPPQPVRVEVMVP